jgi:3-dehydroquinate synthetase
MRNMDGIVRRAMAVKIRYIEQDPYERGERAALNLGHTVGHAVELASEFRLRHGEAVAIGMVVEARLAERLAVAGPGVADAIRGALSGLGLPVRIPPDVPREEVLRAMRVDKKKAGSVVKFALPVEIGRVRAGVEIRDLETVFDEAE